MFEPLRFDCTAYKKRKLVYSIEILALNTDAAQIYKITNMSSVRVRSASSSVHQWNIIVNHKWSQNSYKK